MDINRLNPGTWDGYALGGAGMLGSGLGLGALSVDALRRNGWQTWVEKNHAPVRASLPIAAAAGALGALAGGALTTPENKDERGRATNALRMGAAFGVGATLYGLYMAHGNPLRASFPGEGFLWHQEFLGTAAPIAGGGLTLAGAIPAAQFGGTADNKRAKS